MAVVNGQQITRQQLATELNEKLISQMNLILAQLAVYEKTLTIGGEGQMALSILGADWLPGPRFAGATGGPPLPLAVSWASLRRMARSPRSA